VDNQPRRHYVSVRQDEPTRLGGYAKVHSNRSKPVYKIDSAPYRDDKVSGFHQLLSIKSDICSRKQEKLERALNLGYRPIQMTDDREFSVTAATTKGVPFVGSVRLVGGPTSQGAQLVDNIYLL
jgi:hypothetical protein